VGQREALANALILYLPFVGLPFLLAAAVLSAIAAAVPLAFAACTLAIYLIGFVLFLTAKISLLRKGLSLSFGSSQMSLWNRRAYRAGYALMGFAVLATLSLFKALGGLR
jgi:hypothetical protein